MTVSELIEYLSDFEGDKEVFFSHPSHDYWGTELASPVELVEPNYIKHSDYHRQNQVIRDIEDFDDEEADTIILIS